MQEEGGSKGIIPPGSSLVPKAQLYQPPPGSTPGNFAFLSNEIWRIVCGHLDWTSVLNFRITSRRALEISDSSTVQLKVVIDEWEKGGFDWRLRLKFDQLEIRCFNQAARRPAHPQALREITLRNKGDDEHSEDCACSLLEEDDDDNTIVVSPQNLVYLLGQGTALQSLVLDLQFRTLVCPEYPAGGFHFPNLKNLEITFSTPTTCMKRFDWSPSQNLASLLLTQSEMPKMRSVRVNLNDANPLKGTRPQLTADVLHGLRRFGQNLHTLEFGAGISEKEVVWLDFVHNIPQSLKLYAKLSNLKLHTNIYLGSWAIFLRGLRNLVRLELDCEDSPSSTPLTCAVVGEVVANNARTLEKFRVSYVFPSKMLVNEIPGPGVDLRPFGLCDRLTQIYYTVEDAHLVNLHSLPPQIQHLDLREFHVSTEELLAFSSRTDMRTENLYLGDITAAMTPKILENFMNFKLLKTILIDWRGDSELAGWAEAKADVNSWKHRDFIDMDRRKRLCFSVRKDSSTGVWTKF